jgi:hypothetical protein
VLASCSKEDSNSRANILIKQQTWEFVKSEQHEIVNGKDTLISRSYRESWKFFSDSKVEYLTEFIVSPIPVKGKWWLSDNDQNLNIEYDIKGLNERPIGKIIELKPKSMILRYKFFKIT